MTLIKEVRVRPSDINNDNLDIKVSLIHEDGNYYKVIWSGSYEEEYFYNTNNYLMKIKRDFFIENVSMDDNSIIKGFNVNNLSENDFLLNEVILLRKKMDKLNYQVIQDPYTDTPPKFRNYGFDPYYMNNGCKIYINWFTNQGDKVGGISWSNDNGDEISSIDSFDKSSIYKNIIIKTPKDSSEDDLTLGNNKIIPLVTNEGLTYSGATLDRFIINEVMRVWNLSVPTYITELCSPSDVYCNVNPFISPSQTEIVEEKTTVKEVINKKIKLNFSLDTSKTFYANEDLPPIVIFEEGVNINFNSQGFEFTENLKEELFILDSEYTEVEFAGLEEEELEISLENELDYKNEANAINAEPVPPSNGNWVLDLIPGQYVDNSGNKISLCQIDGTLINVKIAPRYLDMKEAARKEGIVLKINSGFRSPYDMINTTSNNGVKVKASSQEYLYNGYKAKKPGFNLAARPGKSNHGNGLSLDLNTGSRRKGNLNNEVYTWLVKNSWKYGFLRAVKNEEWHFDYLPSKITSVNKGPYSKIEGTEVNLFYSDLGLNNLI